jgi:hypothetical protein
LGDEAFIVQGRGIEQNEMVGLLNVTFQMDLAMVHPYKSGHWGSPSFPAENGETLRVEAFFKTGSGEYLRRQHNSLPSRNSLNHHSSCP